VSNLSRRLGDRLRYIKLKLVGTRSNRDALSAKVVITAAGRHWTQVHDGKSGYLSQSSLPLYFGLGDAATIDRIDVTWPSGATSSVKEDLPLNRVIEIIEPRS
jgi:hypothetical protein